MDYSPPCSSVLGILWAKILDRLPCPPPVYAEYIMQNARLDESQAGIKIAGRNINNLRYANDTTQMEENKEGTL